MEKDNSPSELKDFAPSLIVSFLVSLFLPTPRTLPSAPLPVAAVSFFIYFTKFLKTYMHMLSFLSYVPRDISAHPSVHRMAPVKSKIYTLPNIRPNFLSWSFLTVGKNLTKKVTALSSLKDCSFLAYITPSSKEDTLFLKNKLFLIDVQLLYNIVLVSAMNQS